jgi:hypothetical protein
MTPDRNKLQKYFADLSRVCDVEDTVCEWFDKKYHEAICQDSLKSHIRRQIDDMLGQLKGQFSINHVEVGGIDFSVWKIFLEALKAETKSQVYPDINVTFKVSQKELVNEVKKVGVIIDRGLEMQFRQGDMLIIYVSMGGWEK